MSYRCESHGTKLMEPSELTCMKKQALRLSAVGRAAGRGEPCSFFPRRFTALAEAIELEVLYVVASREPDGSGQLVEVTTALELQKPESRAAFFQMAVRDFRKGRDAKRGGDPVFAAFPDYFPHFVAQMAAAVYRSEQRKQKALVRG